MVSEFCKQLLKVFPMEVILTIICFLYEILKIEQETKKSNITFLLLK